MKTLMKGALAACLIMGLLYPVFGEVVKESIDTDNSWMVFMLSKSLQTSHIP